MAKRNYIFRDPLDGVSIEEARREELLEAQRYIEDFGRRAILSKMELPGASLVQRVQASEANDQVVSFADYGPF